EGDVVGIDVAAVGGRRRPADGGTGGFLAPRCRGQATAILTAVEELHVVGVDLGPVALLTGVLVVPGAGLQPPLDVDETALLKVLATELGELAVALVPDHDVVVVGVLAALAAGVLAVPVGGQSKLADRGAGRRVAQLRVARQPADEHHPIQRSRHQTSSSSSPAPSSSSSSSPRSSSTSAAPAAPLVASAIAGAAVTSTSASASSSAPRGAAWTIRCRK